MGHTTVPPPDEKDEMMDIAMTLYDGRKILKGEKGDDVIYTPV